MTISSNQLASKGYTQEQVLCDLTFMECQKVLNHKNNLNILKYQIENSGKKELRGKEIKSELFEYDDSSVDVMHRIGTGTYTFTQKNAFVMYSRLCKDLGIKEEKFSIKSIVPEKIGKINVWNFVAKDHLRPALSCVCLRNGKLCAADGYILLEHEYGYPSEYEGAVIKKNGDLLTEENYPTFANILPGDDEPFDTIELLDINTISRMARIESEKKQCYTKFILLKIGEYDNCGRIMGLKYDTFKRLSSAVGGIKKINCYIKRSIITLKSPEYTILMTMAMEDKNLTGAVVDVRKNR